MFSVTKPTIIICICYEQGRQIEPQRIELQGQGLIINGSTCDISGPTFRLPATITGTVTLGIKHTLIYVPDQPLKIVSQEHLTMLNNSIDSTLLSSLDQMIAAQHGRISMGRLLEHVQSYRYQQQRRTVIIGSSTAAATIFCGTIGLLYYVFKKKVAQVPSLPTITLKIPSNKLGTEQSSAV